MRKKFYFVPSVISAIPSSSVRRGNVVLEHKKRNKCVNTCLTVKYLAEISTMQLRKAERY